MTFFVMGLLITAIACSSPKTGTTQTAPVNTGGNTQPDTTQTGTAKTDTAPTNTVRAIKDVLNETFLGKTVTVKGSVVNNVNTSAISGFRLKDDTGSIPVSSRNLPKVNSSVTVTGIVQKSSYFGIYIVEIE